MYGYAGRRVLQFVPVLIGATLFIFALAFALPGDPARALAGEQASDPTVIAAIRQEYRLDEPFFVQYWHYITGLARGDFGVSYTGQAVMDIVTSKAPVTLLLAAMALGIQAVLGIGLGIIGALHRGRLLGGVVMTSTLVTMAIPVFVSSLTLQLLFAVELGLVPPSYVPGDLRTFVLPALSLGLLFVAYVARLTRVRLVESLESDYVRAAIVHGLPRWRVVIIHALRNSLIPVVTFLGYNFGTLLSGAVIVEGIFNLPGVGNALFRAITLKDQPTVIGLVTVLVVAYLVINLLVDLLYGVLDPRIRYGERAA